PRNRVIKDEALLEMAAHPPGSPEGLERVRAVPKGFAVSKLGKGLWQALSQSHHAEPPTPIEHDKPRRRREASPAAIDLLKTLLRLRAEAAHVAPRLIANADDIERLAAYEDEGVVALHGWRAEVFGNDAKALRDGKLAIALEKGEAVVVEMEN
ncbi:MAG: HRDC domain-containing protein, partial [Pseudomonadota bacterium]|nr:HRDC domain-containing protein [Pseudomonadota bacterium]